MAIAERGTVSHGGALFFWCWMQLVSRFKSLPPPLMDSLVSSLYLWCEWFLSDGRSHQGHTWFQNLLLDKGWNGSRPVVFPTVMDVWSQEALVHHLSHSCCLGDTAGLIYSPFLCKTLGIPEIRETFIQFLPGEELREQGPEVLIPGNSLFLCLPAVKLSLSHTPSPQVPDWQGTHLSACDFHTVKPKLWDWWKSDNWI